MAGPAIPGAKGAAGAGGGFNKLFVMVPVMLAARKLDAEDPDTVQYLRIAYGSMQTLCVLVVVYTYIKASQLSSSSSDNEKTSNVVYVPAAPTPFADAEAKKKYTEVEYRAHIVSTARSLLGSTLFGVAMTVGLHIYKGMAMGLAIQTVMGPFNLIENPLVKALLMGNGFRPEDKIFDEKAANELSGDDEVVDESGNIIEKQQLLQLAAGGSKKKNNKNNNNKKSSQQQKQSPSDAFEELLLDTWDNGNKADISALMEAVNKTNCNHRSKENGWTPLMILSGLTNAKNGNTAANANANSNKNPLGAAIQQVIALGGNPAITDGEGWNALHWAAFHGSATAAKELYEYDSALLDTTDKEGKLPLEMAHQEDNKDVAIYLEEVVASAAAAAANATKADGGDDDVVRKRK